MAPNNKAGDLSHSAQKKVNAAAKKGETKTVVKTVEKKPICKICRSQVNSMKDMKAHFEAKHPKETFNEADSCV